MNKVVNQLSNCTNMNLRKATRLITQAYDNALQPLNIKSTQFTLLATLSALGDPPLTKLANVMVMDRTTLTRNLKPLIKKGLVSTESEQDQRVRQLRLTPSGRQLLKDAMPKWQQIQMELSQRMGHGYWEQFINDLHIAIEAMNPAI